MKLSIHDVQFVFAQILIAESHASGQPIQAAIENSLAPSGLRTVDVTANNVVPITRTSARRTECFLV
jgi:hypothetical protein